jgi:hypothetical protein
MEREVDEKRYETKLGYSIFLHGQRPGLGGGRGMT